MHANEVSRIADFCHRFSLAPPVPDGNDANSRLRLLFDSTPLVAPYARGLSLHVGQTWRGLRWTFTLLGPPTETKLYRGADYGLACVRLAAWTRPDMHGSGAFLVTLLPEIRQLIRQHLDPVSRIRLGQTSRACYREDYPYVLPKKLAACQRADPELVHEPAFRAMAIEWLENFGEPCFVWLSTAISTYKLEKRERVHGQFHAALTDGWATWYLDFDGPCPRDPGNWKERHKASLVYCHRAINPWQFQIKHCGTCGDVVLARTGALRMGWFSFTKAPSLRDLWAQSGPFIAKAVTLNQSSIAWTEGGKTLQVFRQRNKRT